MKFRVIGQGRSKIHLFELLQVQLITLRVQVLEDTRCSGTSSIGNISTCRALKPVNNFSGNETMYVLKIQHVVKHFVGLEPTCLALWRTESLFASGGLYIFFFGL